MGKPNDLVQGTLDLLILKVVSLEPKHGWAIAKRIQQISKEQLQVQQGSLYPALYRLEQQGWVKAEWRDSDNGRKVKFYALTAPGRRRLERALDDELKFHLEQERAELSARGLRPEEARAAALRAFGSVAAVKDDCRSSLGLRLLDETLHD